MQSEIERLEDEGTELRSQLAAREETNKKLSKCVVVAFERLETQGNGWSVKRPGDWVMLEGWELDVVL